MTAKTSARLSLSQFLAVAIIQSRLALLASPKLLRGVAPFVIWGVTAITLGLTVGFVAVVFPPTGTFGIVSVAGLALLWVMPDFRIAPITKTRFFFFLMLIVFLCIPNYYTVQVSGLPWISLRRISLFPLIMIFLFALAMSSYVRRDVVSAISANRWMTIGIIGFLFMIIASFSTSIDITSSVSGATDALLSWYVPWFAAIYAFRSDADLLKFGKILAVCAVFVCGLGVVDFFSQRHIALDVMPRFLVDRLMVDNPAFARMVTTSPFRNGYYRASSIYDVSLSFGEFAGIVAPVGLFYAAFSRKFAGKAFGYFIVLLCWIAVFASGARGGYVSLFTGSVIFVALWYVRAQKFNRNSIAPAFVAVVAAIVFSLAVAATIFWPRVHNMVLGGGEDASSTDARFAQWEMAKPHIIANPITGHGFNLGGVIIDNGTMGEGFTIDSYVISLLVETGVPSLIFFVMILASALLSSGKRCVNDPSEAGAFNGALAAIVVGFATDRLVLSQHENHTLMFVIFGLVMVSNELYSRGITEKPAIPVRSKLRRVGTPAAPRPPAS